MGCPARCHDFVIGTWNVKGLTDEKLVTIFQHMITYGISILCLQETRAVQAVEYNDSEFCIILFGEKKMRSGLGSALLLLFGALGALMVT